MKAARLHKLDTAISIDDVVVPEPGPGEVLIEMRAAGLCGSDVHIYRGATPLGRYPLTLGHENAGVVADVGDGVAEWKAGDRVCVNFLVTCGACRYCVRGRPSLCRRRTGIGVHHDGGFATYLKAPARNLVALPESVSYEAGALATDAIATPYHAITRRMRPGIGDAVVVYGLGGLGFHAVQLLKLSGARVIAVDINVESLERAAAVGADHVVDARAGDPVAAVGEFTDGLGADFALELVGHEETIDRAVASVRPGGRAVIVGHGADAMVLMPPGRFVRSEIEVVGSYAFETPEIAEIVRIIASGLLDLTLSVSAQFALTDVNDALGLLMARNTNPVRLMITDWPDA